MFRTCWSHGTNLVLRLGSIHPPSNQLSISPPSSTRRTIWKPGEICEDLGLARPRKAKSSRHSVQRASLWTANCAVSVDTAGLPRWQGELPFDDNLQRPT